MKDPDSIQEDLSTFFSSQRLAVLATHDKGQPYTSLVAFLSSKDLKNIYFATTRATRKYANLMTDPRVSMLIDNRSNEMTDFRSSMAVTATGNAEEVEGSDWDRLFQMYIARHPNLEEFVSSPTCALLRIRVEKYYVVTRFQNVEEVSVKP